MRPESHAWTDEPIRGSGPLIAATMRSIPQHALTSINGRIVQGYRKRLMIEEEIPMIKTSCRQTESAEVTRKHWLELEQTNITCRNLWSPVQSGDLDDPLGKGDWRNRLPQLLFVPTQSAWRP